MEQDSPWEMLSTFTALSPSSQFPNTETLGEFLMCDISHAKVDTRVNHVDTKFGELKRVHGERVLTNNDFLFSLLNSLTETSVDR